MAMKWYKLLTRFFIWAFAVALLTCGTYGIFNSSDILINADPFAGINHPTIEKIVIITGIMMICVALLAIISGIALLKRKRSAPKLLTRTLVLWTAVSAFYFFTTMIHFATHSGKPTFTLLLFGILFFILSMAPSVTALILNIAYFKNRTQLFNK